MKIRLLGETELTARDLYEDGLSVTADGERLRFGAMEMFVTSLALCTYAVLASYARQIETGVADLQIHVRWRYRDRPYRIDAVNMDVRWPELPENRVDAATRAGAACTLRQTVERGVEVEMTLHR